MQRHAFGLVAVLFLVAAAVQGYQAGWYAMQESVAISICLRVGLVLGAIWLAYPQLQQIGERTPPWVIAAVGAATLILLVHPKAFRLLLPLVAVLAVLQFLGRLVKPAQRRMPTAKRVQGSERKTY